MFTDDTLLVQQALRGDQDAFIEIYERYQPNIYAFTFYRVGDAKLAEDLTAEVFVRLVEKINTFSPQGHPLLAWLYTIARNLIIDHHRHNGHLTWLPLEESLVEGDASHPAQVTERRIVYAHLLSAINRLTEDQRQVILLKFVADLSNAEVAGILGKNEGSIKSLQHRALAALRNELEKE